VYRKLAVLVVLMIAVIVFFSSLYYLSRNPYYEANVDMKIVYANFWNSTTDEINMPYGYTAVSYVVVLNVTNYAPQPAFISIANIIVGENITQNVTAHQWSFGNIQLFDRDNGQLINLNVSNNPQSNRLITITGVSYFDNFKAPDLYAHVIAEPPSENGKLSERFALLDSSAFQPYGDGYLYNDLLKGNQKLVIDGAFAYVVEG
jgi:archaellum component FlaF (FlaF/FlaG flagellin family)